MGAVRAVAGWGTTITRVAREWLYEQRRAARSADRVRLEALKDDRRPVIGGGISVLRALFDLLDIDELHPAVGALRQGVLYDMLDRERETTDVRAATVRRLAHKFGVDTAQAHRVGATAVALYRQLHGTAGPGPGERKLEWAATLHEIGSAISHSDAHKHGAYIIDNADAFGFTQWELHRLSLLVLGHRGKLRKLDADFGDVPFVHQLLCLRLAVILCHARRDPDLKGLALHADGRQVTLAVRPDWAHAYPQSAHLLREEAVAWQKTSWTLQLA